MAFFSKVRGMLQHKITSHMGREISASTPFLFQAIRCMSSKLFVGGLSYQMDEETLQKTFENYGQVYEARIILDRQTGNSRGFGFITFESEESANSAIMALDGQELQGRRIKVNHAHDRGQGFGGGRGYQGGGGYGGNYQGGGGYGGNYQGDGGYGGNYQSSGGYGGNYQGDGGYGGNYQGSGGYNNYGNNFQGGEENYSNNPDGVGGYNTTGGGSYDSNYASSGGNHSKAGGNYPSSGGNIETGGDFTSVRNESYDQPLGVAFGGAGSDNYNADGSNVASNFTTSGNENAPGLSYDGAEQFGNNVNGDVAYDNESNDYQDRRAS